jgi:hypothetical protein
LKSKVHQFNFHDDDVIQVEYSNTCEGLFFSTGLDRRICLWDTDNISTKRRKMSKETDKEESPPELIVSLVNFNIKY